MSPQDAIRKWWLQTARLGMYPSQVVDTLIAELAVAGFEIVPKKKLERGSVEPAPRQGPRPPVMTNAISGEGMQRGVKRTDQ